MNAFKRYFSWIFDVCFLLTMKYFSTDHKYLRSIDEARSEDHLFNLHPVLIVYHWLQSADKLIRTMGKIFWSWKDIANSSLM